MSKLSRFLLALVLISSSVSPAQANGDSTVLITVVTGNTFASGGYHTCAVTVAGDVRCWGGNSWGQATVPSDLGVVSQVSLGELHTCAVTVAGAVRCWGDNFYGQATVPSDLGAVSQVSAGRIVTCALTVAGAVRCWGRNNYGQLNVPSNLGVVSQVTARGLHACALTVGGAVRCWGDNYYGQATVPSDLGVVSQVSAGGYHTCALTVAGAVRCWGSNVDGRASVPSDLGVVSQVSAGGYHTCAVTVAGAVRCWGSNVDGQASVPFRLPDVRQPSVIEIKGPVVSSSVPIVTGAKSVGSRLKAQVSGWEKGTSFSYQWYRGSEMIVGATSNSYLVRLLDLESDLTVRVTGSKDLRSTVTRTSPIQRISSVMNSPCPGKLDTTETWLGYSSQPSLDLDSYSYSPEAGMTLKGLNGDWPPGTKFCVFWLVDGYKVIPEARSPIYQTKFIDGGKNLQYFVVGTDKKGKSYFRYSDPIWVEPCVDFSLTSKPLNAVNGVAKSISGSFKTCSPAKSVQYREKPYGKSWGSWKDYPATTKGKFSFNRTFSTNSKYELRVNNAGTWLSSGEQDVAVRIKYALPISFSWKAAKNSQGFNQGGNISIKFTGDKEFNGLCTVASETDYAYNFAGVAVGNESKFTTFNVRNGYGVGNLSLTWNGKATVVAVCQDPHFIQITDFRFVTFVFNF